MAKFTYITPVGVAQYPHLDKPDTKFDDEGVFNTGLILDEKGVAQFNRKLDEFVAQNKFKTKKPKLPVEELDDDKGYLIRAKSKYQPPFFDSKNNKLPGDARIGGGSKLRLLVEFNAYDTGVNLYLKQVQVIELNEYGGGSAFDEVEDGYEAEGSGFAGADADTTSGGDDALSI